MTDEDGRFQLHGITPWGGKGNSLRASADGFATVRAEPVVLKPGEVKRDVLVRLEQAGAVVIRVVDERGNSAGGVQVQVWSRRYAARVWSDVDGRCTLEDVPSGRVRFEAVDPDTGALRAITTARADAEGQFKVAGLAGGVFLARAYSSDHPEWLAMEELAVASGESRFLDIMLQEGARISAQLVSDAAVPVGGMRVRVTRRFGAQYVDIGPDWAHYEKEIRAAYGRRPLTHTNQAGVWVGYHVPPGPYRVDVLDDGKAVAGMDVMVVAGRDVRLRIPVPRRRQ